MEIASSLRNGIQKLSPSYFALVMATGILATASHMQHYEWISRALFLVANIAFVVLLLLFIGRTFLFSKDLVRDLSTHDKGAGFLTTVAAAGVLGSGYAQAKGAYGIATALLVTGLILWMIFIYAFLAHAILKNEKPSTEKGMNATWLLLVVSTQSLSILGGAIAPRLASGQTIVTFLSLAFFLLGMMLYLVLMPIDLYRLFFYPVTKEEVLPSYWINMGAAAITTLAGNALADGIGTQQAYADFYFFVKPAALMFWAMGSFWIPLLVVMEAWRYLVKRSVLKYDPAFWSLVFPLGMYAASTGKLATWPGYAFLRPIAVGFCFIGWAAWLLTFIAMAFSLLRPATETTRTGTGNEDVLH